MHLLHDLPKNVQIFAVHPGSVKTDMNPTGMVTLVDAATKILAIPKNWDEELNGKYLRNDESLYLF